MLSALSLLDWVILFVAGFSLGLSKSGVKGLSIINVALLVLVFGAKPSTGILLPMLIVGDVFAVIYYNRHAQWKYLFKLMPFIFIGILIGTWVGNELNETVFRKSMAVIILASVFIMFWWEFRKTKNTPDNLAFAGILGLTAGFTTMVGNLAGAFANLYFLAMRFPKNQFIGTTAWLFLLTNLFKVPFHIWSWHTINLTTLEVSFVSIPFIFLGLFTGVRILKMINEVLFRRFILVVTALGAILIFFS